MGRGATRVPLIQTCACTSLFRLVLKVQKQVEIETKGGDADKRWKEVVEDLWDNRLFHFQKGIHKDVHTGQYGFQVGSENEREESLTDAFMNEPALKSRTKEEGEGAGQPEGEGNSVHMFRVVCVYSIVKLIIVQTVRVQIVITW